jgi:muramoyltetrapeptide carboxypeptidase LdcA involved in peptidoglycan recycling
MTLREYESKMTESEYMETLMNTLRALGKDTTIAEKIDELFPELTDRVKSRIAMLTFCMDDKNINDMLAALIPN